MCGIYGYAGIAVDSSWFLENGLNKLIHRGPDGLGQYTYQDFGISGTIADRASYQKLMAEINEGDTILVDNNTSKIVNSVDYLNKKIYLTTNLSSSANSYLSVKRTFVANSSVTSNQIKIINYLLFCISIQI